MLRPSTWLMLLPALTLLVLAAGWRWAHPPAAPGGTKGTAAQAAKPGSGETPLALLAEDATTRTIGHVQGTSVIPRHPQRVAVLGWNDEAVALGVVPVAAGGDGWRGFAPHLRDHLVGTRMIDSSGGGPDLEGLAEAKPDLIVAAWFWLNAYPALSRIAPTVVLQPSHQEWRQRFRDLALVLDRQAEAESRLAALDLKIAETRVAIHARIGDQTVALVRVFAREYRLYGKSFSGPLLYDDLGLTVPQMVRDTAWNGDVTRLSIEGLCRLDADHILLMTEEHIPVSFQVRGRLEAHPLWARIPAVKAGQVHLVPDLVMRGGIIAREQMLDVLRQALAP